MFKRIANLFRGFLGLFISGLESKNSEALLENEKENLRTQIAQYNQGLAAHAGICEKIKSQVDKQEAEVKGLTAKAGAHLKAGNRKLAGEYALRLQKLKEDLEDNKAQLAESEDSYEELKRARDLAVTTAKDKIEQLGRGINETKIAKATAEMNEMAAGLISSIGSSGDTLNRLEESITEEKEKAKGRARVAKDSINTTDLVAMEGERKALEEMALAEFAAEAGIVVDKEENDDTVLNTEEVSSKQM
jgi:phage shock protein A